MAAASELTEHSILLGCYIQKVRFWKQNMVSDVKTEALWNVTKGTLTVQMRKKSLEAFVVFLTQYKNDQRLKKTCIFNTV